MNIYISWLPIKRWILIKSQHILRKPSVGIVRVLPFWTQKLATTEADFSTTLGYLDPNIREKSILRNCTRMRSPGIWGSNHRNGNMKKQKPDHIQQKVVR